MEDRDFFDKIYQLWAATTGAEGTYWMPEPYTDNSGRNRVWAVAEDESRRLVAEHMSVRDSAWLTAMHGCFPDLHRRLHSALDEADRADLERDSRECRIAELEMEVSELRQVVDNLSKDPPWGRH